MQPTQDELNALNIIGIKATELKNQLEQVVKAQQSVISLLEKKYGMVFNKETREFRKENM
jgi:hypothetical protein